VRLADLLAKVGTPLGSDLRGKALADYVVATGSDGYRAVLALSEIDPDFHPGEVVVADAMNGKALDDHSGPMKLVVAWDKRPAGSVRNLVKIELRMAE
jgi:DMSO/TMAO reductase YedYZ molybdopterin-dependent catalytic subunit